MVKAIINHSDCLTGNARQSIKPLIGWGEVHKWRLGIPSLFSVAFAECTAFAPLPFANSCYRGKVTTWNGCCRTPKIKYKQHSKGVTGNTNRNAIILNIEGRQKIGHSQGKMFKSIDRQGTEVQLAKNITSAKYLRRYRRVLLDPPKEHLA